MDFHFFAQISRRDDMIRQLLSSSQYRKLEVSNKSTEPQNLKLKFDVSDNCFRKQNVFL